MIQALMMLPAMQTQPAFAAPPKAHGAGEIQEAQIGPPFKQPFMCMEHPEGQLDYLGDALGTDCMVAGGLDEADPKGGFMRLFKGDGARNADWYGWHAEVLAPFDGAVKRIVLNPVTNQPGTMGKPPAQTIVFQRADGVVVIYGHVTEIRVKEGQHVSQGQVVALDGNNGMARSPHVHVGAFRGSEPLQIRWDLRIMGRMMEGS
jgi:hypothetical protein